MYEQIIERWKIGNPGFSHGLGFHEFDGLLEDYTRSGNENRINEIKADLEAINAMDKPVEKMPRYEYDLLKSILEVELYLRDVEQEFFISPIPYIFGWFGGIGAVETSYTQRSFAPIDDRIRSIIRIEQAIPEFLNNAKENLKGLKMSKVKLMMSLDILSGKISYFSDELIEFITQSGDGVLIEEWSQVNIKAVDALNDFFNFIKSNLENSVEEFALGEDKFMEMLKYTEKVDTTVERLLEIGEADLETNLQYLRKILDEKGENYIARVMSNHPTVEELIPEVERSLDRTRQFLLDNDLVTIPSKDQCKVIYTPKSERKFAFAAMNTPGPFEVPEAREAYYWVTPPDPEWNEDKQKEFLTAFNRASLENTTVHEAWPGHYLQLLYNNQTESDIAKMFAISYSLIEGWGLYCEELIYEQGYQPPFDRSEYRVGQLIDALIRNVRYIVAIKMHCRGMSVEEAKTMFIQKAFMTELNATIEANRGTIDPMYLNYTLGKIMIKKLRDDYRKEKGENFNLKEFHDKLLSFGSPPITVLRNIMLKNPSSEIF